MAVQQVKGPDWLKKNDWYSSWQTGPTLVVSHDKKYMFSKRVGGVPLNKLVGPPGSKGLADGIQAAWIDVNNGVIPYEKTWTNAQCVDYPFQFDISIQEHANRIYGGNKHPALVFAQLLEDSNIHGSTNPDRASRFFKVEQIFKRVAEMLRDNDGIAFKDNELVSDYFAINYGWATNAKMDQQPYSWSITAMSSKAEAQKTNVGHDAQGNEIATISNFYANNVDYRGRMVPGYVEGLGTQKMGAGPYLAVQNLERNYIAEETIKCICYANGQFEGLVYEPSDKGGVWACFPIRDADGDLIRLSIIEGSWDMLRTQTFLNLLIGDRYVIWDDNSPYGLNDKNFGMAYMGGDEAWKTQYRKNGGGVVQYDKNNPTHPKSETTGGQFATNHSHNNNSSWEGNYLYGQVWDWTNGSLKWPVFDYVENGVAKTGYYNGNIPVSGVRGTEVSRRFKGNPGQNNIVHQFHNGRKPIVFEGTGVDTSKKCYIVLNVNAGFNGTTTYNLPNGVQITHTGTSLGIYKIV